MYCRNRFNINESEQKRMRDLKIVFGGLGLGSVIAECALRMGFENLHLIDGDVVELSNLNRQNYTQDDIGKPKCEALYKRLKQINPHANITYSNIYLTSENVRENLADANIAVNAIDFTSDAPFIFDDICFEMGIPVVHPYNLGYGGLVYVSTKENANFNSLSNTCDDVVINIINHALNVLDKKGFDMSVFKNVVSEYLAEQGKEQPPQLSIGAQLLSGLCTDIFLTIIRNESISVFPDFYYVDRKLNSFNHE
jgi:molybdopterin/thiamine biosynthesis adenylyltransferase